MSNGAHPVHDLGFGGRILRIVRGDITLVPADAVVNAANSGLVPGGGVDGAIHRAGGPEILADLRSRYGDDRHCDTGKAVVSVAGRLPATWVIHAVGPTWAGGQRGEEELLASAYRTSLAHADALGAASMTFPAISCGIFGYPLPDGARVALETVRGHLSADRPTPLVRVTFVLFSEETLAAFEIALGRLAAT